MKGFFYSWDCKRKKINQDCDGPLSLQLHSLSLSSLLAHFNYEPWRGRNFTCLVIFRLFCIPLSLKLLNFTKRAGNEENSISSSKKWNFAVQVRYRLCADVYIGGKQGETINISRGDSPLSTRHQPAGGVRAATQISNCETIDEIFTSSVNINKDLYYLE